MKKTATASLTDLQVRFLEICERIETHARIYFRNVKCWVQKSDFVAETIALAWKWFRRRCPAGQGCPGIRFDPRLLCRPPSAVAAALPSKSNTKDILSEVAQQRHGLLISKLPDFSTLSDNPLSDALIDNTRSPVPEQVQFRLDLPDLVSGPALTVTAALSATWRWSAHPGFVEEIWPFARPNQPTSAGVPRRLVAVLWRVLR